MKTRKLKTKVKVLLGLLVFFIVIIIYNNTRPNKEEIAIKKQIEQEEKKIVETQIILDEIELNEKVMALKTDSAKRFVENVNSEVELIVYEETGSVELVHTKSDGFFTKSNINLLVDYKVVLSVPTNRITINNLEGDVFINYSDEDIKIKSIEFNEIVPTTDKAVFGSKYKDTEILALVNNSKDLIKEKVSADTSVMNLSKTNLATFLLELSEKFGVKSININGEQLKKDYNFIKKPEIQMNNPNKYLQTVDYIVIHSTAVPEVNALDFYERFNTNPELKASAHFLVDDTNVVQCLPVNKVAWAVGKENYINNYNSISIEMCEGAGEQKTIENTANFVKDILQPQFPNAKVVMHRDFDKTKCPSILSDEQFEELFIK